MNITKRNGTLVEFNEEKIKKAVVNAAKATNHENPEGLFDSIKDKIMLKLGLFSVPHVEDIQESIIDCLLDADKKTAIAFIKYRERRRIAREGDINAIDIVDEYIIKKDDMAIHENSSTQYSMQGLNQHIFETVVAKKWLNLYSDDIKKAYDTGRIHIHDIGVLGPYCFTGDTKIYCLDGHHKSFKELCDLGIEEFWTFAIDASGNEVPALAKNPRVTRKNAALIEIELDNGEKIKCTPDHHFMLRDGSFKSASELQTNDSLRALSHMQTKNGYSLLFLKDKKIYEHRHVASFFNNFVDKEHVVHHLNKDKLDNRPENLEVIENRIHRSMECAITMNKPENKQKSAATFTALNKSEVHRKRMAKLGTERIITDIIKAKMSWNNTKNKNTNAKIDEYLSYVEKNGFKPTKEYLKTYNHRIVSITKLDNHEDVYDVTVDVHHNFLLSAGVFVHNCMGHSLSQLLEDGFTGVPGKVSAKPAKHFSTALGQANNFLFTLQGEAAGAQAFSNFNTLLAPFVAIDELSYKEVKQQIQEFIFNLNTDVRVGFQAPFTNITLDMDVTKCAYAEEGIIVGGVTDFTKKYKEFQKEATWISQAFIEVMEEGDSKGAMFSYPIITFNVTADFPWRNKLGESLLKLVAKYGTPYFANYINSEFAASDILSLCCRLKIDKKEIARHLTEYTGGLEGEDYEKTHQKGHGFFGASPNTGSIGVVTLNIPAIAHDAVTENNTEYWDIFYDKIKYYMDLATESLLKKRKFIEQQCEEGLYPYTRFYLRHVKARTGHYFTQHFNTICTNGIHEALIILGIKDGIEDNGGHNIAYEILRFMNQYTLDLQKKHHILVNLEQAPAESAGVKLCKKSGVDPLGNGYYTNSSWLPADSSMDIYDQIIHQGKLNEFYTGGSSMHTYTDVDLVPVYKDLEKLIVYTFTHTKLPYMTISPVYSVCDSCGRIAGKHKKCPKCGSGKIEVFERIVGYYRSHSNWNTGRSKESKKRKYLKIS